MLKAILPSLLSAMLLAPGVIHATVLRIGPDRSLRTLTEAVRNARDGDVIEVDAGEYADQTVFVSQRDLTIRGIGGPVRFQWRNGTIGNGKGIFVIGRSRVTLENLEISGARVKDGNGAGIRVEPKTVLTVRNCRIHDNENGLLTANDGTSDVEIENSEFDHNGSGTGKTHNIYIGAIASFSLRFSHSHGAHIGHNVKSRARKNIIAYNRIMDEVEGDSSYLIDLPNGGETYLVGNLIQKGRRAENPTLVSYGAEGFNKPGWETRIYVVNNTFVSEYGPKTNFLFLRAGTSEAAIVNNIFSGFGKTVAGPDPGKSWSLKSNLMTNGDPGFRSADLFDYSLTSRAVLAIDKGTEPGSVDGVSLLADRQYAHPLGSEKRVTTGTGIDIGAYEHPGQDPR